MHGNALKMTSIIHTTKLCN